MSEEKILGSPDVDGLGNPEFVPDDTPAESTDHLAELKIDLEVNIGLLCDSIVETENEDETDDRLYGMRIRLKELKGYLDRLNSHYETTKPGAS